MKPKIAILTIKNSYKFGGVFSKLKHVYNFCEKYFEPTIFALNFDPKVSTSLKNLKFSSEIKKEKYEGMNYVYVGARWAFWEPGHYVYTLSYWKKVLKGYDYFVVVSGNCIPAYPLIQLRKNFAMWIASDYLADREQRLKGLSVFRKIINSFASKKVLKIEKEILQKADFIWALSKYTKKQFEQILGVQRDDMIICNCPLDTQNISCKGKCGIFNEQRKSIIAVGRFSDPRKNIQMLLRVFDKLYSCIPELKLYVVGKQPTEKILSQFKNQKSFKNIIFTGQVSAEKLDELYGLSLLMLIPSYQEGLGIIGLESFAHGVPVVATDCGGPSDFIVQGQNGYLVKVDDDDDMVDKALRILQSNDLQNKMSMFAQKFVQDNFSVKKFESILTVGLMRVYPELKDLFNDFNMDCSYPSTLHQGTTFRTNGALEKKNSVCPEERV